jgi:hypothetical protein
MAAETSAAAEAIIIRMARGILQDKGSSMDMLGIGFASLPPRELMAAT